MARTAETGTARQTGGAAMQGRHGAFHGVLAQSAGMVKPLAQPDDAAEAVDHTESIAGRGADQQAAVVGSQVERGEGRPRHPG